MINLTSCPKTYAFDQDKAVPPEQTLAHVRERLAGLPLIIVRETRRIDTGRLGIPVYLSRCGDDASRVMPTRKQMGKGASPVQAETSALMELMERYGFFTYWQRPPGAVQATWSEAEKRFGAELMPIREIIRACHDNVSPDDARRIMDLRSWIFVPATRIIDGNIVYAPLDLFKQLGEFNGSSAGNTDVESIMQGACELVERHCCCRAVRERPLLPSIDIRPASFDDAVLADLLEKFHANGISVLLKDFSLGMPVPTVAALAHDPSTFPHSSEIVFTAGTAATPAKAAIRALTEVAQLAGDFHSGACYEASGLPKYGNLEETAWLRQGDILPLDSLPSVENPDLLAELAALAEGLARAGFPLYSVATTNPDTRVLSHYSFAPGLQFRERDANASLGLFVGRLVSQEEELAEADQALSLLARITPEAHYLPFFRGMLALRACEHSAARSWFGKAEALQPDADSAALAAFYSAYALTLQEDWEQALPGLDRAVFLDQDTKEYLNLRGVCLFKLRRYEEAARDFQDILTRLDKGSVMDIQNLGLCHKFLGNTLKARHYLKAALELAPGLTTALEHLHELETERSPG